VADGFQRLHFADDLVAGQRAAVDRRIGTAEAAVDAIVGAVVRDVQRREQHDAAAVDLLLDRAGELEDFLPGVRVVNAQQHRHLFGAQALLQTGVVEHLAHPPRLGGGGFEDLLNFVRVDECVRHDVGPPCLSNTTEPKESGAIRPLSLLP